MSHLIDHLYPTRRGHRILAVVYLVPFAFHVYGGWFDGDLA